MRHERVGDFLRRMTDSSLTRAQSAGNAGERPATQTADASEDGGARAGASGLLPLCKHCGHRIWPWQARYTVEEMWPSIVPAVRRELSDCTLEMLYFHGECACDWLLAFLNGFLVSTDRIWLRRVVGWGK